MDKKDLVERKKKLEILYQGKLQDAKELGYVIKGIEKQILSVSRK